MGIGPCCGERRPARTTHQGAFPEPLPLTDDAEDDAEEEASAPKPKKKGLQFKEDAEELEAASTATNGEKKNARLRINTGFEKKVKDDDGPKRAGLKFDDNAEEFEAASEGTNNPSSVRARINTGFEKKVKPDESGSRRGLQFNYTAEVLDAASFAADGATKTVRGRINTGFERQVAPDTSEKRAGLKFNDEAESLDAASEASEGPKKEVRRRVNTGFARDKDLPQTERKPLKFAEEAEELEAASSAAEGNKQNVRQRVNTGFMRKDQLPNGESKGQRLQFKDGAEQHDAASTASEGPKRQVRKRVNTGFIQKDESEDEEEGEAMMMMSKLSSMRASRKSRQSRSSVTSDVSFNRTHVQHMAADRGEGDLPPDSPEIHIEKRRIPDAKKDGSMLHASLEKLPIFEGVDTDLMQDLIEQIGVFEFQNGDQVVRQGDTGGTHFFVVAEGGFEIVKDDKVVVELQPGATFGESVLLNDGTRGATVRAKGVARVYGMLAADVRDMMHVRYEMENKEVVTAVTKIIESGSCEQFAKLNAFQRHELYTESSIRTFEGGEAIITEGRARLEEVNVLLQGSVMLRTGGQDVRRVPRYEMLGMRGMLFGEMPFSMIADGSAKTLAISRNTLESMFTQSRMPSELMRPVVDKQLNSASQLASLHEEQREQLGGVFDVREVSPNSTFDIAGLRLLMCLHGSIEVSRDDFKNHIERHHGDGVTQSILGMDKFFDGQHVWETKVRPASGSSSVYVATWTSDEVNPILTRDEKSDRIRILKSIFLFRTLTKQQIDDLASSMDTKRFAADEKIFSQGDHGDFFCIVASGRVFIEKGGRYIRGMGQGDYFGERALLKHEPRSATVKASQDCEIWSISSDAFKKAMPPAAFEYLQGRTSLQDSEYTFEELAFVRVIGTGGFGTVKMVRTVTGGVRYALKCVRKRPIVEYEEQITLVNEREVLQSIDHPFIIKLVQTFRNEAYVYFLLELVTGGELLGALEKLGTLNQSQAQFYSASIILALEHLHARRIAYLDLKSENVLLDHQGYTKLVDFGLAAKVEGGLYGAKGTPHFMSPEMIIGKKPYDTTADLWALGICIYEFVVGQLPFGNGSTVKSDIFAAVLSASVDYPASFQSQPHATEARSLIDGLLQRIPTKRLGGGRDGYTALQVHGFFQGLVWDDLLARRIAPPYIPEKENYAEGDAKDPNSGKALSKVENHAVKEEMKSGWKDPNPGWDDEFGTE